MARIRSIHPDACDSSRLAQLSSDAERLYWRLQTHCDDHGRCEDNPRLIHARCAPLVDDWTPQTVEMLLTEMETSGLIHRYADNAGIRCIEVDRWTDYQHPNRPKSSKYGPYDPSMTTHGAINDDAVTDQCSSIAGGERRGEATARERGAQQPGDIPCLICGVPQCGVSHTGAEHTEAARALMQSRVPA